MGIALEQDLVVKQMGHSLTFLFQTQGQEHGNLAKHLLTSTSIVMDTK